MIIKFALGWNRISPVHELQQTQEGFIECSELLNYVARNRKIKKIGGTEAYNSSALTYGIPWVHRSYHKRGDGTFTKVLLCFSNGAIYYGDDVAGTLTSAEAGFTTSAIPMSATIQVAGNSILYVFMGELSTDEVFKYDGNGSYTFEKTTLNTSIGRVIESGFVHLDRMWYISKNSSILRYSRTLYPEDFSLDSDDIIIGQETDSCIRRGVVGPDETLYIFKNQSIWQLYGRTTSTFQFRQITDKYGLASKRAIYPVGGGFIFLNEFDKELYFFGGSESSIQPLTENTIRFREILDHTRVHEVTMTVHDGLFRCAFKHKDDDIYQDRELVYPINEPRPDGLPKWSMTKGAKVLSYAVCNQQGDDNLLISGRSDTGKLMYHNRTNDFDGTAIETIVRTGEVVASEDQRVRFKGFQIKGRPGSRDHAVEFRYFLDGRYTTSGLENKITSGETRQMGQFFFSTQALFNNRIIPLHRFSLGNSISFQIRDNKQKTDMELYSVAFKASPRGKIRNKHVSVSATQGA